jgi:hypothetical protein
MQGKLTCTAVTLLLFMYHPAAAVDMVEGEWELTVKHTVGGMPINHPDQHFIECFTQTDPIPTSYLQARSCQILEQNELHRTVSFKLNCMTENGPIINEGKIHFSSLKISGESKTDLGDVAGKTSVLRYRFTGRRLGDCQK